MFYSKDANSFIKINVKNVNKVKIKLAKINVVYWKNIIIINNQLFSLKKKLLHEERRRDTKNP